MIAAAIELSRTNIHNEKSRPTRTRVDQTGPFRAGRTSHTDTHCSPSPAPAVRSRTLSPAHGFNGRRRGRTLSPLRKSLPNSSKVLSPLIKKMSNYSSSKKIKEALYLLPNMPIMSKSSSTNDVFRMVEHPSNLAYTQENQKHKKNQSNKSTYIAATITIDAKPSTSRYEMPFNENGFCSFHPDVRLAKTNHKGGWKMIHEVCPQCAPISSGQRRQNKSIISSSNRTDPKKHHELALVRNDTDTEPTSSCPESPSSQVSPKPAFSSEYFYSNRDLSGLSSDLHTENFKAALLNASHPSVSDHKVKRSNPCTLEKSTTNEIRQKMLVPRRLKRK